MAREGENAGSPAFWDFVSRVDFSNNTDRSDAATESMMREGWEPAEALHCVITET